MRSDGATSPAATALDELRQGWLKPDPDHVEGDPWPDEEQPADYFKLMAMLRSLCSKGVPTHSRAVNDLEEGIWEFKVASKRFTFYDTDGAGTYTKKYRIRSIEDADYRDDYWWFPVFDHVIRLGHVFVKTGRYADGDDIDESLNIREEDVAHDRPQEKGAIAQG